MAKKEGKKFFLCVRVRARARVMLFLLNVDGILQNKNRTHIRVFREKK